MSLNQNGKIKDVFNENVETELKKISELIDTYNYVSMDTEFPGIVFPLNLNSQYTSKNIDSFVNNPAFVSKNEKQTESNYKNIKMNVDNLKMIQIGITLSNESGDFPEGISTWQFNFKFNLDRDPHLNESINLLDIAGIDFKKFLEKGIDIERFGELFTTSGLVLNDNVRWITFHGSYDFAYLIKALSNQPLPEDENLFNDLLSIYFCNFYDVRQMIKNVTWLKGSLSRISADLDIKRIGQTHQAGSDSLVTAKVFFKLLSHFNDHIDVFGDKNKLFGFSYKMIDDYDWNVNMVNNFGHWNMPLGAMPNQNLPANNSKIVPKTPANISMNGGMNNMMYFQQGYNYQNGNVTGLNNIPFYGNNNMNYNPMYSNMDYNYYAPNFYPGGNFKNSPIMNMNQNVNIGPIKDNKFLN